MTSRPEMLLPPAVLSRGMLWGNEWAWRIAEIPAVIEAARLANLVSVGGQLQFRLPDGATCELYWIEVDTTNTIPCDLPWLERVERTAVAGQLQFEDLLRRFDFIVEGRAGFGSYLEKFEADGGDLREAMWFVWYLEARPD